jgi:hypothetical protein
LLLVNAENFVPTIYHAYDKIYAFDRTAPLFLL